MNVTRVSKTTIDKGFLDRTIEKSDIERDKLPENLTEALIVYIARVSSSRENKWEDHHKLIRYLIENAHWSPFEHAFATYEIETSRAIGRQLLRHRSFTFQEFSQRYSSDIEFEDVEFREQPDQNRQSSKDSLGWAARKYLMEDHTDKQWSTRSFHHSDNSRQEDGMTEAVRALQKVENAYRKLVDSGVASETARMILPECTQTTIYMTGSLRSWIHFLDLRDDNASQKEIRKIASEIRKDVSNLFPNVAKAANLL